MKKMNTKKYDDIENWSLAKLKEEYNILSPIVNRLSAQINKLITIKSYTVFTEDECAMTGDNMTGKWITFNGNVWT